MPDAPIYSLYGDPAYPQGPYLLGSFRNARDIILAEFNTTMLSVRQAVEWGVKNITQQYALFNFTPLMKIFLSPVALYYYASAFLFNLRSCIHKNQISAYFDADVLSIHDYLDLYKPEYNVGNGNDNQNNQNHNPIDDAQVEVVAV